NVQKNSGLNLEHAYSEGAHWAAYYYLLQIAHVLLQLLEKGSLLRRLAQEQGKASAVALFGSLKNMAERLLESLRNLWWPEEAFAPARLQIRFDSSSGRAGKRPAPSRAPRAEYEGPPPHAPRTPPPLTPRPP